MPSQEEVALGSEIVGQAYSREWAPRWGRT
jgi:hypothetical protein